MLGLSSQPVEQFLARLASARSACLMLDYDGTLAPFTTDRAHAAPFAGIQPLVADIARTDKTRVVIISGRGVGEFKQLLSLDGSVEYWGSYGAERQDLQGQVTCLRLSEEQAAGLAQAEECLYDLGVPGKHCERKPVSVALHWRGVEEPAAQRWQLAVVPRWAAIAATSHLAVRQFSAGVEIMPANATKASAVLRVLADADECMLPAYLGDDETDEEAFSVIPPHGLSVLVGDVPRQTAARVFLERPREVLEFLQLWLARLS